jgi:copper chaperone
METTLLKIGGMTCGGCVSSVTRVLKRLPGVRDVKVSLETGEARVNHDPAQAGVAALKEAVTDAGYEIL